MKEIFDLIGELSRKASQGRYLFRGESRNNPRVSSRLFREIENDWKPDWDIEASERALLQEARRFTGETSDSAILSEIQHYGGPTNLIDFTTDILVALYFACDGDIEEEGRFILLRRNAKWVFHEVKPDRMAHRITAQKSIFVRPPRGFIEDEDFESHIIPHQLKGDILEHLQSLHGISLEYIYNDLHGFIRYRNIHRRPNEVFFEGLNYYNAGDFRSALSAFSESIRLNPRHDGAFNHRGATYLKIGERDSAKRDFAKALDLNAMNQLAYFNRGVQFLIDSMWDEARDDLVQASLLGSNFMETFRQEYGTTEDFEKNFRVKLPEEIVRLLEPDTFGGPFVLDRTALGYGSL